MPKTPRRMKIYHYHSGNEHHFTASRIFFTAEQLKQAMILERKTKARQRRRVINRKLDSPISSSLRVPHYDVRLWHSKIPGIKIGAKKSKNKDVGLSFRKLKTVSYLMVRLAYPYPLIRPAQWPIINIPYAKGFEPGGRGLGAVFHLRVMEKLLEQYPPNMEVRFWSPSDELIALLKKAGLPQIRNYTLQEHVKAFRELARKNAESRKPKQ